MDEAINNITEALQDQGLWEDTLLVFTTDVSSMIVDLPRHRGVLL